MASRPVGTSRGSLETCGRAGRAVRHRKRDRDEGACEMSCMELAHQAGAAVGVTGRVLTELTVWGKISQTVGPGGPKTRVSRIEIIDREWLRSARLAFAEQAR